MTIDRDNIIEIVFININTIIKFKDIIDSVEISNEIRIGHYCFADLNLTINLKLGIDKEKELEYIRYVSQFKEDVRTMSFNIGKESDHIKREYYGAKPVFIETNISDEVRINYNWFCSLFNQLKNRFVDDSENANIKVLEKSYQSVSDTLKEREDCFLKNRKEDEENKKAVGSIIEKEDFILINNWGNEKLAIVENIMNTSYNEVHCCWLRKDFSKASNGNRDISMKDILVVLNNQQLNDIKNKSSIHHNSVELYEYIKKNKNKIKIKHFRKS